MEQIAESILTYQLTDPKCLHATYAIAAESATANAARCGLGAALWTAGQRSRVPPHNGIHWKRAHEHAADARHGHVTTHIAILALQTVRNSTVRRLLGFVWLLSDNVPTILLPLLS